MNQLGRLTDGWHKLKPAPRRHPSMIQMKDVLENRVAATKAAEQPTVQVLLTERRRNSIGYRSFHGSRRAT